MLKRLNLLTIILLTIITSSQLYAQTPADNEALLLRAEAAFKQGNELLPTNPQAAKNEYRKAVNFYNSIIESGVTNAGLYYNTGNAYVRLEETGNAILNYRKALLYSSNDPQIRYNLEYARSLQKNGFTLSPENEVQHILLFWHYLLPSLWKMIILIISNLVFWSALIMSRFGRPVFRIAIISLIVALMMGGSFIIDIQGSKVLHGVVTADSTIGRLGDSKSYEPAFDAPLYEGVEFSVKQRRVGWLLAELPDGELVWVEESDCGIVEDHLNK